MKFFLVFTCLVFSLNAFADISKECGELKNWRIRLALTSSNLLNVNSTRTPEGGPYRPFDIKSCSGGECVVERVSTPLLQYLPGHPDANSNGYVAFPNIDQKVEYMTFLIIAKKLRQLAADRACGANLFEKGDTAYVRYMDNGIEPQEDQFAFDKYENLVSWAEIDSKGSLTSIQFTPDGNILSK